MAKNGGQKKGIASTRSEKKLLTGNRYLTHPWQRRSGMEERMTKPLDLREWAREHAKESGEHQAAHAMAEFGEKVVRRCAEIAGEIALNPATTRDAILRSFQLTKEGEDG